MNGLVILVTGASSGIGHSIASHLALKGYLVIGTSRNSQSSREPFSWEILNVESQTSVQNCIKRIISQHKRIDVVINNAGMGMISSLEEAPMHSIEQVLNTNLMGVVRITQAVLPHMRAQENGKIINISSIAGLMGLPYRSIYSASKFAVEGLTESLRTEVRKFGIEVCTLQPGSILTDIQANRASYIPAESAYNPELIDVERIINEEVSSGIPAKMVALAVERILRKKRLDSKYVVAKPFQKLVTTIQRLLPSSTFERMLMRHYDIKS